MLKNFAFIVKAPGYMAETHHAELVSVDFSTQVMGVSSLGEAITSAQKLIQDGVQLNCVVASAKTMPLSFGCRLGTKCPLAWWSIHLNKRPS